MVDLIEISLGIVAFTLIVNLMIFVILFARTRLVSTGDVKVEINGDPDKTITVPAGGKLLQTLADQNLFLSSNIFLKLRVLTRSSISSTQIIDFKLGNL